MKSNTIIWAAFTLAIVAITLQACKKDEPAEGIDLELLNMSQETSGFTWYKNSDAWLPKSAGSGHNYTSLRTRYNTTAATQLDGDGKVLANASFPDGSLVVKELSSGTSVERYAILYKMSNNEHADANGWVWGYVNSDGTVATTAEDKGAICTGCHLQSDNIDYMLMNKFFP
ncbi:MAG: cytochrome P460 family protein [Flavobacteriales bacterium]|nr:cytochrome P460 family protein [Flavobacteriales bacterium]MCB9192119.1 cytochrome P460 family protein [Flavobacteriales bacterium]MCB9203805.1 cytochrome P460 family protein [Flavobacteriales bacterium]